MAKAQHDATQTGLTIMGGIVLGTIIGALVGIFIDNVAMGIGVGVAIGAAIGGVWIALSDEPDETALDEARRQSSDDTDGQPR